MSRKKQKSILTPQKAAVELRNRIYEIEDKNPVEAAVWKGVLDLIEKSRYGKKSTQVLIDATPRGVVGYVRAGWIYSMFGAGAWNQLMLHVFDACDKVFCRYGETEVLPRPRGPATCSMVLDFRKK